jgi:hypothetical protein
VVGLGLARVPDDEVAAEGRVGLAFADLLDSIQEPLAGTPISSPAPWLKLPSLPDNSSKQHPRKPSLKYPADRSALGWA